MIASAIVAAGRGYALCGERAEPSARALRAGVLAAATPCQTARIRGDGPVAAARRSCFSS
ncbi:protein of unknown function (plasmid) [Rhodovastum atsumiense]|nr:protein of unknown function [Rhodovastum atsumiense]